MKCPIKSSGLYRYRFFGSGIYNGAVFSPQFAIIDLGKDFCLLNRANGQVQTLSLTLEELSKQVLTSAAFLSQEKVVTLWNKGTVAFWSLTQAAATCEYHFQVFTPEERLSDIKTHLSSCAVFKNDLYLSGSKSDVPFTLKVVNHNPPIPVSTEWKVVGSNSRNLFVLNAQDTLLALDHDLQPIWTRAKPNPDIQYQYLDVNEHHMGIEMHDPFQDSQLSSLLAILNVNTGELIFHLKGIGQPGCCHGHNLYYTDIHRQDVWHQGDFLFVLKASRLHIFRIATKEHLTTIPLERVDFLLHVELRAKELHVYHRTTDNLQVLRYVFDESLNPSFRKRINNFLNWHISWIIPRVLIAIAMVIGLIFARRVYKSIRK